MTSVLDDTDAIRRRAFQIRGEESGVCLKATAKQMTCWCYQLGQPPFPCRVPPDAAAPIEPPMAAHDILAPTLVPWFEVIV